MTIAVASNFTVAMNKLIAEFEALSEHRVVASYGSSGKLYSQIINGAPFQLFFSADQDKPQKLIDDEIALADSRFTYVTGALVLWSATPDFIDAEVEVLKNGKFNKLALANPKLAPYGIAAIEVLEYLQIKEATQDKWVQGENIAQTYQFVRTGNAELGFVALSQIQSDKHKSGGSHWIVPQAWYTPIRQDAVLLKRGEGSAAAMAFLEFMQSKEAKKIITSFGYEIPTT